MKKAWATNIQFNGETDGFDLITDIEEWVDLDGDDNYTLAQKTKNINLAYDRVAGLIMRADNRWEWDDNNQTNLPIATTPLVIGQSDYGITQATFLKILKVMARDAAGIFRLLQPIDRNDRDAVLYLEQRRTNGTPIRYDKLANSVFLDPPPSYAHATGLRIFYQRNVSYFTTADTTKVPGFARQFHGLLSLHAAKRYAMENTMPDRLKNIKEEIVLMEAELIEFYSRRNADEKISLRVRREDHGENELMNDGARVSAPWRGEND